MNVFRNLRDVFISGVSVLGLSWVYRMYKRQKGPLVRVVVFHDVKDGEWFRRMIENLHENYHVITPEDFIEFRFNPTQINVLLTFDDGYSSWVDICLPVLESTNTQALFFINSGLVDVSGDLASRERYVRDMLLLSPRAILSWEGVKKLQEKGHMIGGHTVTHTRLSLLQEREQRDEIFDDKERIESHIGKSLTLFAYPFGQLSDYTEVTIRLMKESSYRSAFTTEGVFTDMTRVYALSRLCFDPDMTPTQMRYWVEGGYDIYQKIKKLCVR